MDPFISVIIPVYNASKYLRECLESVVNQTYGKIQIICVDDGSTDASRDILISYAQNDDRVVVIHKENEGVSLARNAALETATGEYVLFVDGDDWIEPNTCSVAISAAQQHDADVVMWSYIREMHGVSRKKTIFDFDMVFDAQTVREKLYRRMIGVYGDETAHPENADALCTVWGKLYRRSVIEDNRVRFHDIREIGTYEDGLFNLNVFANTKKAVFINHHFYHYRRNNETSLTTAYNADMPRKWDVLFDILLTHIRSHDLDQTFYTAFCNRIVLSLIALGINETECGDGACKTIKRIKALTTSDRYRTAIKAFDFRYLPTHWKIFFACAKYEFATGVYLLLAVIQKIRGR